LENDYFGLVMTPGISYNLERVRENTEGFMDTWLYG
jgi:hypothetical protein